MDKKSIYIKGSVTVEAAYMMPVLLAVFFMTLYTVFYFHDKAVLNGAAGETAAVGAQYLRHPGEGGQDLESFYTQRVENKLILLQLSYVTAQAADDSVQVSAGASCGVMSVSVKCRAAIQRPEKKIRQKRRLTAAYKRKGDKTI